MAIVIVFTQAIVLQAIKVSPRTLVRSGLPFFATGMLVIGLANSIIIVFIGYALLGLSFALTNPGINAAATLSVEPEEYGAVAGLLAAAPTAGIIFGPLIGATLYGIAPNMPMLFGAGVIAVLAVYAFLIDVPNPSTD
jgi:predicted MFS family arabinose efflux permease